MRMKKTNRTFKTTEFIRLHLGLKDWLNTLGYSESTVYGMPRMLGEFLYWLESLNIFQIQQINQTLVNQYLEYIQNRPNKRTQGALSTNYINKQIESLQKFIRYLKETNQENLNIEIKQLKSEDQPERTVLSRQEVEQLYRATDNSLIGIRDRAMLSIYYGCGLRRKEGISLEVSDVLFERRLLYVRKTKNGYERYVPMNVKCLQDLEIYIYSARNLLLDSNFPTEMLFISERGKPIDSQSFKCRLKVLKERTNNPELQNKSFGLHALRHSIATHLLQAGIELENVGLFLGHKCLDSTQLYTHIINEL
jgi:integrase/recombinase XerD